MPGGLRRSLCDNTDAQREVRCVKTEGAGEPCAHEPRTPGTTPPEAGAGKVGALPELPEGAGPAHTWTSESMHCLF